MLDADHCSGLHPVNGIEEAFHLIRTDLHAPGLDHVVHTSAKIQVAVLVEAAVVAGIQHALSGVAPRLEFQCGCGGIAPIASHDRSPANHQLANLMGLINAPVLVVHQPQFGVGNGDTDAAGLGVDVLRWQVGTALTFGQTVHRVNLRLGKQRFHLGDMRRLERCTGVGDHAYISKHRLAFVRVFMQQHEHGGHEWNHGDLVLADLANQENRPGEFLFQHQSGSGANGHDHLVQAVVEGQRQRTQHVVALVVAKVGVQ